MHPITRKAVNAYSSQIAALNGVDRISEKFKAMLIKVHRCRFSNVIRR